MKLTVIGGGGVRSMFLAKSLAQRATALGIDKLVFMDNDPVKLSIFGKMAREVAKRINPDLAFELTDSAEQAVEDADYVITTIRVGGDETRCLEERAALSLGILGQETTGAAGMSFAMRSIPALIGYCELIKKHSKPSVKVFNFTNPAGLVSQALRDLGYDFTFGICDAPSGMLRDFAEFAGVAVDSLKADCYGANHLSFFSSITDGDRNILAELIDSEQAYEQTDLRYFDKAYLREKRFIPNEYLYYYYQTERAVQNIIAAGVTRGEVIARVNESMIAELRQMDVEQDFDAALAVFEKYYGQREASYMANETGISRNKPFHFDVYSEDSGGYAGVALKYIELSRASEGGEMIMCIPNKGALSFLPDDDVVEITCTVDRNGCTPKQGIKVNEDTIELIKKVKTYERTVAKAIEQKSIPLAVRALESHPLVGNADAEHLVSRFLKINKPYTEGWK